jgi:cytochrome c553
MGSVSSRDIEQYKAVSDPATIAVERRMILLASKGRDSKKSSKTAHAGAIFGGLLALSLPAHALENTGLTDVIAQCAACHGAEGIAKDVEIPNLAGQHDRYLITQLQNFRSGKRPHKEMRYMSRHITDDEIEAIAQYYAHLPH